MTDCSCSASEEEHCVVDVHWHHACLCLCVAHMDCMHVSCMYIIADVTARQLSREKTCLAGKACALTAHLLFFHHRILFQYGLLAGMFCLCFGFCRSKIF